MSKQTALPTKFLGQIEKMWQLIIMVQDIQDTVSNDIVSGEDLICIDPHWVDDHEIVLEVSKDLPSRLFLDVFDDPDFGNHNGCE